MAKKKAIASLAAPESLQAVVEPAAEPVQAPTVEPVVAAAPQETVKVVKVSKKPAAKKTVVAAKKKAPAKKKTVVKQEAEASAPVAVEPPKVEEVKAEVEAPLPVLKAEVEADEEEKQSFVSPPKAEAEEPVFPISRRPAPRPQIRPVAPPVRQTTVKVETKTKAAVAVGLATVGVVALATAGIFLSLNKVKPVQMARPAAPAMQTPSVAVPVPKFAIAVRPAPSANLDIVADNAEHAIATFDVSTGAKSLTIKTMRVQLLGSQAISNIIVRDESGNPVMGSSVPVPDMPDQFDITVQLMIPENASKSYTVFASLKPQTAPVVLQVSLLGNGFSAVSASGMEMNSMLANLVGPAWRIIPAAVTK